MSQTNGTSSQQPRGSRPRRSPPCESRPRGSRPRGNPVATTALVVLAGTSAFLAGPAWAEAPSVPSLDPSEALSQSAEELEQGRYGAAIARLEYLADHGVRHPDLSFNRGLAYWSRARGPLAQTGDYGQAAAGFAEAHFGSPTDAVAERGLEEVQLAAAKKRNSDENTMSNPLGLVERVLLSFSPWVLFLGALCGSLATTLGVVLFRRSNETHRTVSFIALCVGTLALSSSGVVAALRGHLNADRKVGVVVTGLAPLLSESGKKIAGEPPLVETTVVHVGAPRHGLAPLLSLGTKRWIRLGQIRIVSEH